jgi:hypothetical protein
MIFGKNLVEIDFKWQQQLVNTALLNWCNHQNQKSILSNELLKEDNEQGGMKKIYKKNNSTAQTYSWCAR